MKPVYQTLLLGFAGTAIATMTQPALERVRDALWGSPTPPAPAPSPAFQSAPAGPVAVSPAGPVTVSPAAPLALPSSGTAATSSASAATPAELGAAARVSVDKGALQDAAAAIAKGAFGEFLGPAESIAHVLDHGAQGGGGGGCGSKTCCSSCKAGKPCEGKQTSGAGELDEEPEADELDAVDVAGIGCLPIVAGAFNPDRKSVV